MPASNRIIRRNPAVAPATSNTEVKESAPSDITIEKTEIKIEAPPAIIKQDPVEPIENIPVKKPEETSVDIPIEEEVKEEKAVEVKEEKKEKKNTKRGSSKKKEKYVDINIEESIDDIETIEEFFKDEINPSSQQWEEEKEELLNKVNELFIDEDINPQQIQSLIFKCVNVQDEFFVLKDRVEKNISFIKDLKEKVTILNSVGSNTDERKINSYKALVSYRENPEDEPLNLLTYCRAIDNKYDFINTQIKRIANKKEALYNSLNVKNNKK